MSKASQKVEKVKVAPYPISAVVHGDFGSQTSLKGNILKLSQAGLLIEIPYACVTGQKYEVHFTLPVIGIGFKEPVVVIKSYDSYKGKTVSKSEIYHLCEFHFRSINGRPKLELENFLRRIGQIK